MKVWLGLRITADVDGNGPAVMRRVLTEIAGMIERGEFAKEIPCRTTLGDGIVVELGVGPVPPAADHVDVEVRP